MRRPLLILLAVPLLTGCGSGKSTTKDSQFVAKADSICAAAQKKAQSLVGAKSKLNPQSLDQAAAIVSSTANELRAVRPPAALRAGYQRYLTIVSQEIDAVKRLAHAIDTHDTATAKELAGKLNSSASNEHAALLGLRTCAQEKG